MSRVNVQTIEEKFMFGSPPLLDGFSYYSCRFEDNYSSYFGGAKDSTCDIKPLVSVKQEHGFYPSSTNPVMDSINQLSLNDRVENGFKMESSGNKLPLRQSEPVFPKRKDLSALQNSLSKERFRQVTLRLEDWGDEGGKEILTSVHDTMKKCSLSQVTCLFCDNQSKVYESFPVVDGTLFLTPIHLSLHKCVNFVKNSLTDYLNYMCYICIDCLEGYSKLIKC